uniref:Very short patch repair endonuclease n=1 Tax=Candidatus Kentrum sp. SD TaxID=2126332 RepID=A0A450YEC6_9GAMM|nr:MAG: T/G mismatch-specific endonuclease [Candidatus Kentron sp. SD]VFK45320.1 MAG: T/G mismatch-specific endonuclease [Candidatus Kentron sp. SD]
MVDRLTLEQRRRCMSRVRAQNTKPEILLRKALWMRGARYRLRADLPGKPDLVFSGKRVAVFVDGCFWHGCPIHGGIPATNREFWEKKLGDNVARDRRIDAELSGMGWRVLRVWTHEIKQDVVAAADRIMAAIRADT